MHFSLRRDTRDLTLRILLLQNQENGNGKTGLTACSPDLSVVYIRDDASAPTQVALIDWETDSHIPGGFREIDSNLMPGLYELALPNELCQEGARHATLMVRAPGVNTVVIHLDLIAYDPYDGYRLGLECLSRDARHDVIATAFRQVVPEIVKEFRGQV